MFVTNYYHGFRLKCTSETCYQKTVSRRDTEKRSRNPFLLAANELISGCGNNCKLLKVSFKNSWNSRPMLYWDIASSWIFSRACSAMMLRNSKSVVVYIVQKLAKHRSLSEWKQIKLFKMYLLFFFLLFKWTMNRVCVCVFFLSEYFTFLLRSVIIWHT